MTREQNPAPALFTQVEISAASSTSQPPIDLGADREQTKLLKDILAAQDRQNDLLEELVSLLGASQRQRATELAQWKQANPRLAKNCRLAAECLSRVHTEFLGTLTREINENSDSLMDGEFLLNEFVDRFGPRLAHLNGVLQVLTQLSTAPASNST